MTTSLAVVAANPTSVAKAANNPLATEQEAGLYWENISFVVPLKGAAPKPKDDNNNVPQTSDRLGTDAVPQALAGVVPEGTSAPPEVLNGQPMRSVVWNLTGSVRPGEFVGLLGPSGAGKTVLLNILSSRLAVPVGSIYQRNVYVNNKVPLSRELFGKLCTYVMQDDVLMETMTPFECLSFSANLRLSCSQEEKDKHVIETIALLKLQTCMNTLVGSVLQKGISGGERRRTAIGVEIVTNPSIIILDELTSGLDSFTAYTIVKLMKDMAHAGKAVMAIVQQPSTDIFNQFDKIYLMSSGREFYQGPTTDIYSYFEKIGKPIPQYTNPGDYVINLMHAKEKPDASEIKLQNEMFAAYDTHARKSITEQITHDMEKAAPIDASAMKELRGSTFGQQCKVLLVRAFKNLIRNKRLTQARIFQTIIISIVLDILFYRKTGFGQQDVRSKNSVLFFMSMTQMMGTMQSVVLSFPLERALFLREYANRMYHTLPYYLSKTAVELPYQLCLPIFFSILVYWIVGLRNTAECFWIFASCLICVCFFANSLGMFLGCVFTDVRQAVSVVPVIILPTMLFSGYMANLNTIVNWLVWLQYISPMRYSMEILFRNEYRKAEFIGNGDPLNPYPIDGYNLDIGMGLCYMSLVIIGAGLLVGAFFFLKSQTLSV